MKSFNKERALKKIKRKRTREQKIQYITLAFSCLTMITGILFFAFAKFESVQEYTLINGNVGEFQSGDYVIGAYVDGQKSKNIPAKDSGYYLQKVECDNDAVGTWDSINWELTVSNSSTQTKCYVYFTTTLALADTSGNYSTTLKNYPVGSIYISINNTNPSTLFGGTWESYGAGRTLVGVGTGTDSNNVSQSFTVNSTGGEYNHTLSTSEMPKHSHAYTFTSATNPNSTYYVPYAVIQYGSAGGNVAINTNNAGGSAAHNNIQPYITVYMWKRTA